MLLTIFRCSNNIQIPFVYYTIKVKHLINITPGQYHINITPVRADFLNPPKIKPPQQKWNHLLISVKRQISSKTCTISEKGQKFVNINGKKG